MDRLFLDVNVLFSAAYRPDAGLVRLWKLERVELISSAYALEEARLNLPDEAQRARLQELAAVMHVIPAMPANRMPAGVNLAEKDRPILAAAIQAKATHLLTGDKRHFGKYFRHKLAGILILAPADYLTGRR